MTTPIMEKDGFIIGFNALPEVVDKRHYFMEENGWSAVDFATVKNDKWFIAEVSIWKDGIKLGVEYCGTCCYAKISDFYTKYKDEAFMDAVNELVKKAKTALAVQADPHGTKLKKVTGMNRAELCGRLAATFSASHKGKVTCTFFDNLYILSGTGLPAAPSVADRFPNGWNMRATLSEEEALKAVTELQPA